MHDLALNPARLAYLPLWLVALPQALWVRKTTVRLPGAAGPDHGVIPGTQAAFRLVVIGESTVAGVGVASYEDALAGQLASAYARRSGREVRWQARGRIGVTAGGALSSGMAESNQAADAVVFVFGVNDIFGGTSSKQWTRDIVGLICAARRSAADAPSSSPAYRRPEKCASCHSLCAPSWVLAPPASTVNWHRSLAGCLTWFMRRRRCSVA